MMEKSLCCSLQCIRAGGYEVAVNSAYIQPFESLKLVNCAVEGMRKLHGPMPEELEN